MASRGKKKTTFAKLARESKLRERRLQKQVNKDARKRAAELGETPPDNRDDLPETDGAEVSAETDRAEVSA